MRKAQHWKDPRLRDILISYGSFLGLPPKIPLLQLKLLLQLCSKQLRYTFTTRLLFTAIPSENYAPNGGTLQHVMGALVDDLNHLYEDGIEAKG